MLDLYMFLITGTSLGDKSPQFYKGFYQFWITVHTNRESLSIILNIRVIGELNPYSELHKNKIQLNQWEVSKCHVWVRHPLPQ